MDKRWLAPAIERDMPDPAAVKPEDWSDEEDGEWEAPRVVCCSVLQCVAVCCVLLQSVAVWCSLLQSVAVCYSLLHSVAVCCSLLQCATFCCCVL